MAQESWKREKEETGCQPPEGPVLCTNGCGFFGSFATMNLCSKCYSDLVLKQAKATSAKAAAAEKAILTTIHKTDVSVETSDQSVIRLPTTIETDANSSSPGSESSSDVGQGSSTTGSSDPSPPRNRCASCKKRVGLTGFKCRCGNTFCSLHRYSDKHSCSYDYKTAGRDAIAQANPVVKAAKIQNKI